MYSLVIVEQMLNSRGSINVGDVLKVRQLAIVHNALQRCRSAELEVSVH